MIVSNSTKNKGNNVVANTEPTGSNIVADDELSKNNQIVVKLEETDKQVKEYDFPIEFLKLENNKQNMIYSPLSIKYALKMLSEGANGNTKTQIDNLVGNLNLTTYNNIDEVLSLANSIYIRDTFAEKVKQDFNDKLIKNYNAEIIYDAFENANNVNNWIENKTFGIIKNMLSDAQVNPSTMMILINALAIDMEWTNTFDGSNTHGGEFTLENGDKIKATMMHKETKSDNIAYYQDENITALSMDLEKYEDTQLEFVAIMPEENLSDYIETFSTDEVNNILENMTLSSETDYGLNISIPRFSFEYDLDFKDDLISLGITEAFEGEEADFSNMSYEHLYVDDALHKANIDFTEKGIKAAAVTVIIMGVDAAAPEEITEPIYIEINKPFLYMIRDRNTGEIWFVGTVYEPNLWENDKDDYKYEY